MAYEYEEYIKKLIGTEAVFSHEKEKRQERVNELQEVYQKAKAYNKIKNIITAGDNVAMDTDSILNEVKKQINDMGDE